MRGLRVLRNAAIAVGVMALVPIGLVTVEGDVFSRLLYNSNTNAVSRAIRAERIRPFRLPTDPRITPMQAGIALNALQSRHTKAPGFEMIEPATLPVPIWRTTTIATGMFTSAQPDVYDGQTAPSSRTVLQASVKGFNPQEMAYLRALATAPVWREFDLVTRAPAVDIVGGQFKIPFGPGAFPEQRPLPLFRDSRELAYAAVSRAAYHMALGQRDSAETILRSIVSFGFTFIDNGSSALEEFIGSAIVGTGRDALQRFYVIQHDPRASLPALAPPQKIGMNPASPPRALMSADDARRRLLARIEDPAVPLGERFEGLHTLSASSCTNVRELLFGPSAEVSRVLANARHTVARYPSEQALVDLVTRAPLSTGDAPSSNPLQSLAVSSATVAGAVLHNPRFVSCTRILTGGW